MNSGFPSCVRASWSTKLSFAGSAAELWPTSSQTSQALLACHLQARPFWEGLRISSASSSFCRLPCRVHPMHTFPPSCFLHPVVLCLSSSSAGSASRAQTPGCSQSTRKPCPSRVFGPPLGDHLPSLPAGHCPEFSQDGADGVALLLGLGGGLTEPHPAPHPLWPAASAVVWVQKRPVHHRPPAASSSACCPDRFGFRNPPELRTVSLSSCLPACRGTAQSHPRPVPALPPGSSPSP